MDNFAQLESFVRRVYNPNNDPRVDETLTIQPYAYRVRFDDLAAGGEAVKNIAISANADFILTSPRYRAKVDDADGNVTPQILVLLTDTGSSEQLTNDQVDISTYFGRVGDAPYTIEYPRIISGRSSLSVAIQNYSAAKTYDVEFTFAGVLVRSYGKG